MFPVLILTAALFGRPPQSPPPLPLTGRIVNVATEPQLQNAIRNLASNTTIVLAAGTYHLTRTLAIDGRFSNVVIRGASTDRDAVVLAGNGMRRANDSVQFGIWTGGGVEGVTIANLTIRDVPYHPIIFNAGTQKPHVFNVHLIDAGQQFIKSNPDGKGGGVNGGIVEYSVIEYTTTAKDGYTNGLDVHTGAQWIVRHNLFRNIVAPNALAGPAVLKRIAPAVMVPPPLSGGMMIARCPGWLGSSIARESNPVPPLPSIVPLTLPPVRMRKLS